MPLAADYSTTKPVRAEDLQEIIDAVDSLQAPGWTSYTPTWTCSGGTNPVLGDGTITGRYRRSAGSDIVFVEIQLTMGSTTTFGNNLYVFSLPFTASASALLVGSVEMFDSGTIRRPGCTLKATTSGVFLVSDSGTVSNTVPWTWATGDVISIALWYQPA